MASVSFDSIVFNLAADLSQTLTFAAGSSYQPKPSNTVSSDVYAAGNSRRTRSPGWQYGFAVNLQAVTPAQRALLELPAELGGWLGETVCFRDYQGRKHYGFWDAPQISEHSYNRECDVSLSFTSITWTEAV